MNKEKKHIEIFGRVVICAPVLTSETNIKVNFVKLRLAFVVSNRELTSILLNLIKSRLNQKLMIELFKTTERACNESTVLSCDLNTILKVVSGYGMPLIVIKSI